MRKCEKCGTVMRADLGLNILNDRDLENIIYNQIPC